MSLVSGSLHLSDRRSNQLFSLLSFKRKSVSLLLLSSSSLSFSFLFFAQSLQLFSFLPFSFFFSEFVVLDFLLLVSDLFSLPVLFIQLLLLLELLLHENFVLECLVGLLLAKLLCVISFKLPLCLELHALLGNFFVVIS